MKLSIKIWLLAIVYQTLIFLVFLWEIPASLAILIPIEFIGGLPGLLIFEICFNNIQQNKDSTRTKWLYTIWLTLFASFATTAITIIVLCTLWDMINHSAETFVLTLPTIAAALLSLATFYKTVHTTLQPAIEARTTDEIKYLEDE